MRFFQTLTFVSKQQENDDVYTFYFSYRGSLGYAAGQHGGFILPGLYRPHAFSLASSPQEKLVAIGTHVATGSRYKNTLMRLQPGDRIVMFGPIMRFYMRKGHSGYVFLAQGIGITPFRSMLADAHDTQAPVTTTLIHVDAHQHTYRHETEQWATHAYYPTNPDEFRTLVKQQSIDQLFYLSGSPKFISATKKFLKTFGVHRRQIKADTYWGY